MTDSGASSYHRFLQGDSAGLEELVRMYGDALVRFAYCFLGDPFAAEDVMEDTFATLVVKRKKFDARANFKAYLFRIARNKCIDMLRTRKRYAAFDEHAEQMLLGSDLEADAALSERNKQLYCAMQQLPEDYRKVLDLIYFENFNVTETAKILKKSRKQVYNLLARAKLQLKKFLILAGIDDENF